MRKLELSSEAITSRATLKVLTERLNFSLRNYFLQCIAESPDPKFVEYCREQYLLKTGLNIDETVDGVATLVAIERLIQQNPLLDLNAGDEQNSWFTPLLHAVRVNSVELARLLIKSGAKDISIMSSEATENPEMYDYFLEVYPAAFQNDSEYQRCSIILEKTKHELRAHEDRLAIVRECKQTLVSKRKEYLATINRHEQSDSVATRLPFDVTLNIFRLLPTINDRCNAALVCRNWHRPATSAILWNFSVLPEFRGDAAKHYYLKSSYSRVTQKYFFQLITRLNQHQRELFCQMRENPAAMKWYEDLIGMSIDKEINERTVLQELYCIIRFSGCVDVNAGLPTHPGFTPIDAAVATGRLDVVRLLVEFGANNFDNLVRLSLERPEIFSYALSVYPDCYQNEDAYYSCCKTIADYRVELQHLPERLVLIDQSERILNDHRNAYLNDLPSLEMPASSKL